jgi:hypothetical protein
MSEEFRKWKIDALAKYLLDIARLEGSNTLRVKGKFSAVLVATKLQLGVPKAYNILQLMKLKSEDLQSELERERCITCKHQKEFHMGYNTELGLGMYSKSYFEDCACSGYDTIILAEKRKVIVIIQKS